MKKIILLLCVIFVSACGQKADDHAAGAPVRVVVEGLYKGDQSIEGYIFKPDSAMNQVMMIVTSEGVKSVKADGFVTIIDAKDGVKTAKLKYKIDGNQIHLDGTTNTLSVRGDGSLEGIGGKSVLVRQK